MNLDQAAALAYHAGRAAWGQLRMDLSSFQRWVRVAGIEIEALQERGEELYLVAGCVAQEPDAFQAFERRYLATLNHSVGRIVLSADQADELRQQLRVTLLLGPQPKIGTFRGQGPLGAWVQVCAVRLALKLGAARDRLASPDASLLEGLVSQDADQELLAAKSQYRDTFQAALEECFLALPSRQKTLLRMHFLDGMSIDEMGQVFHVHRATIARWLVAIRREVLEQICNKISLNLRTSSSEFRSMVRLVQGDVRLSLHRILGGETRGMISAGGCPSEEELLVHLAAPGGQGESEKLLAHFDECAACRLAVAEATRALAVPGHSGALPAVGIRTLSVGERVLGRYEIRRFIARGGMGEVYEAFDLLLDERVALKTLASTVLDDDRAAFRFKGEVRLARKVTHPNVCRILEFGVHSRQHLTEEESVPFLTMEFLSGETLAQRIGKRGPYPPADAMPLVRSILSGLKAIHDAGIVHRDLKSENVFLVADAHGEERVVLMDFGLARAVDGSVPTTMPHRLAGLAGTIDCMAPEQIHGGVPVGPAADVFAVGVLLYEMLSGTRPFVRVPPWQRLTDPSPRLASAAPHVPRAWDALVRRCLERKPEDRFPDLCELVAALPEPGARNRPRPLWLAAIAAMAAAIAAAVIWQLG